MTRIGWLLPAAGLFALSALVLPRLGHPLLWNDEGETVMYGKRVLEYGFPKVHGPRNTVYELDLPGVAIDERWDAFVGSPWLQYYLAAAMVYLADPVDDPNRKTAILRSPFALLGITGVLLWALAIAHPLGGSGSSRGRIAVGALLLLACASISLVLHLREVRYYGPTVFLTGGLAYLYLGFRTGRLRGATCAVGMTVLLTALFHTFLPGFASFCAAVAVDQGLDVVRDRRRSLRSALPALVPIAIAAVLAVPGLWFYKTVFLGRVYARALRFDHNVFLWNLVQSALHLVRYEFLVPALVVALALRALRRRDLGSPGDDAVGCARFLGLLVAAHCLVIAQLPWFFSRYLVWLSPAVSGALVLSLAAAWPLHSAAPRALRWGGAAIVAFALACSFVVKAPELGGRLAEIRSPVSGPLDHVVWHLRERYPDPSALVIATNYEATPLMYYLGAQLVVGYVGDGGEVTAAPDVVIPRRAWPRTLQQIQRIVNAAEYERVLLPIEDLPTNTIPELSSLAFDLFEWGRLRDWAGVPIDVSHRFRTATTAAEEQQLRVYHLRMGYAGDRGLGEGARVPAR